MEPFKMGDRVEDCFQTKGTVLEAVIGTNPLVAWDYGWREKIVPHTLTLVEDTIPALKKRGPKPKKPEDRKIPAHTKNITLDADLQDTLKELAAQYSAEVGCKLTLSQAVRILIHRAGEGKNPSSRSSWRSQHANTRH